MKQRLNVKVVKRSAIHAAQRILLWLSYYGHRWLGPRKWRDSIDWVVGPHEVASMTHFISSAVPNSLTVVLRPNRFYDNDYDITLGNRYSTAKRLLKGALMIGALANRAKGFIYVGETYLAGPDEGRAEFAFLKRRGRALVFYWTGTDIRSTALMNKLENDTGRPNIASYIAELNPELVGPAFEKSRKRRAELADTFSDAMFLHPNANRNYLTQPTEPFLYLFPDKNFGDHRAKFDGMAIPVLSHAASSPVIKGTQLVRAAITRLRKEGYVFEYNELIDADNVTVVETLQRTHISIGHFYGFTPGIYGVESLAATCALVTSASEHLELTLPKGSDDAWFVTSHDEVYQHLRELLDDPARTRELALRGYKFARENFSASANADRLNEVLASALIPLTRGN